MRNLLVTGGAGFIGSNFVRYVLRTSPNDRVVVYDKLTYAGNLDNLKDVSADLRYTFVLGDIADAVRVGEVLDRHEIDTIVNFAAESHVDRSIMEPDAFIKADVYGVYVLLEAARQRPGRIRRVHQVSTDEVYGSVPEGYSTESDPLLPNSPYSASKAGGELLVRAYHMTYGVPTTVTRGSNTYGPYQYPEKMASLFITNAIEDKPLPLYGDGQQVRDWLYVLDHCEAIDAVLRRGQPGEVYNVGGECEQRNVDVTHAILRLLGKPDSLIQPVRDRPGHDRRYALDNAKIRRLGWQPRYDFATALAETVRWYQDNAWWWRKIKTGEYLEYYRRQYEGRALASE